MKAECFCQSCRRPIENPNERGTEKDGSENSDYCRYCYQAGSFTYPKLTIVEMKSLMKRQGKKQHMTYLSNGFFMNTHRDILKKANN